MKLPNVSPAGSRANPRLTNRRQRSGMESLLPKNLALVLSISFRRLLLHERNHRLLRLQKPEYLSQRPPLFLRSRNHPGSLHSRGRRPKPTRSRPIIPVRKDSVSKRRRCRSWLNSSRTKSSARSIPAASPATTARCAARGDFERRSTRAPLWATRKANAQNPPPKKIHKNY